MRYHGIGIFILTEYKAAICHAILVYTHLNTEAKRKAVKIAMADSNRTENIEAKYIEKDEEIIKNCTF